MSKWVTNWSNAISIVDASPVNYAKDVTLRYPILSAFDATKIRITLDNFTGKEKVHFEKVTVAKTVNGQDIDLSSLKTVTFNGSPSVDLEATEQVLSDEMDFCISKDEKLCISIYLSDFTSMRAGVTTLGPLSKAYYSLGNQTEAEVFPRDLGKEIEWWYFLSDVELYTEDNCQSILCFGDSITAQAWPEYLQLKLSENNCHTSTPRKAVSGARMLRQYSCVMYEPYGLKGSVRFPHDSNLSGCDKMIVLQGVNDFIHPVGVEVNPFRPWSDLPTVEEMIEGYRYYINEGHKKGMRVYLCTILPIKGWRTYADFREDMRQAINKWIRTNTECDGFIDFDKVVKNPEDEYALRPGYDSGDHLHPSMAGYQVMAEEAYRFLTENKLV